MIMNLDAYQDAINRGFSERNGLSCVAARAYEFADAMLGARK